MVIVTLTMKSDNQCLNNKFPPSWFPILQYWFKNGTVIRISWYLICFINRYIHHLTLNLNYWCHTGATVSRFTDAQKTGNKVKWNQWRPTVIWGTRALLLLGVACKHLKYLYVSVPNHQLWAIFWKQWLMFSDSNVAASSADFCRLVGLWSAKAKARSLWCVE